MSNFSAIPRWEQVIFRCDDVCSVR